MGNKILPKKCNMKTGKIGPLVKGWDFRKGKKDKERHRGRGAIVFVIRMSLPGVSYPRR